MRFVFAQCKGVPYHTPTRILKRATKMRLANNVVTPKGGERQHYAPHTLTDAAWPEDLSIATILVNVRPESTMSSTCESVKV